VTLLAVLGPSGIATALSIDGAATRPVFATGGFARALVEAAGSRRRLRRRLRLPPADATSMKDAP
jgi:hypothetical protein